MQGSVVLSIGIEQRVQQGTGRVYYIDHLSRSTFWNDPRESKSSSAETATGAGEAEEELQLLCSAVLPEQARWRRRHLPLNHDECVAPRPPTEAPRPPLPACARWTPPHPHPISTTSILSRSS